jgi:hypothetical protein
MVQRADANSGLRRRRGRHGQLHELRLRRGQWTLWGEPSGSSRLDLPAFGRQTQSRAVTCLAVSGNTATWVTELLPNSFGLTVGKLTVVDNGPTGSGLDSYAAAGYLTPQDCASPETGALGTEPLLTGDIVVVDAPPLPTSQDQCEKGGWQTYGLFKNQGDCVSFVATGGKNAPAISP